VRRAREAGSARASSSSMLDKQARRHLESSSMSSATSLSFLLACLAASCSGPRWGKVSTTSDGAVVRCDRGPIIESRVTWFEIRETSGATKLASCTLIVWEDLDGDGSRGEDEPSRVFEVEGSEPRPHHRVEPVDFAHGAELSRSRWEARYRTSGGQEGSLAGRFD
jgi:hypothetical protein